MKKWLCSFLLFPGIFSIAQTQPASTQSFVEQSERGWLWYREQPQETLKTFPLKETTDPKQQKNNPKTNAERIELMRKDFEEVLATALLQPTLQNVTQAKQKQLEFEDRSSDFAKMWVLSHLIESKGYSQRGNPHPWHQEIAKKERENNLTNQLKQLSKTYGLFFAFKQSCPYCHRFAPVVAEFAEKYEFKVKGISKDGGKIEGITNVSKDNGALAVINPEGVYPALFLANPKTMEVVPIAWGMVTTEQLLQNLEVVLPQLGGAL